MSEKKPKNPNLKYIIGDMGIEILLAIEKGARKNETIRLISGVPRECIKGRIPVLLDLNLIEVDPQGYFITHKGIEFLKKLEN